MVNLGLEFKYFKLEIWDYMLKVNNWYLDYVFFGLESRFFKS